MSIKLQLIMSNFNMSIRILSSVDWPAIDVEIVSVESNALISLRDFVDNKPDIVLLDSAISSVNSDSFIQDMINADDKNDFLIILFAENSQFSARSGMLSSGMNLHMTNVLHIYDILSSDSIDSKILEDAVLGAARILESAPKPDIDLSAAKDHFSNSEMIAALSRTFGNGHFGRADINAAAEKYSFQIADNVLLMLPYPSKRMNQLYTDRLLNQIQSTLNEYEGGVPVIMDDGVLCIIINGIRSGNTDNHSYFSLLFDIQKIMTQEHSFHWLFILSEITSPDNLDNEYSKCRGIYDYGYFCCEQNIIYANDPPARSEALPDDPVDVVNKIVLGLIDPDDETLQDNIENLLLSSKKYHDIDITNYWKCTLRQIYITMLKLFRINDENIHEILFNTVNFTIEDDILDINYFFAELKSLISTQAKDINPLTIKAVIYMISFCAHDISLKNVAENINTAPTYLSHLFKREMGMTFIDYYTMIRISSAKYMLIHSKSKVSLISGFCGFIDNKYFSRVFKDYTGMTPSEYRQEFSENVLLDY